MLGYALADHASLFLGAAAVVRARLVNEGEDALVRAMPEIFGGVQF